MKLNIWRFLLVYSAVSLILTFGVVGFIVGTIFYIPTSDAGYVGIMTFLNPFFLGRNDSEAANYLFLLYPVALLGISIYKQRQDIQKLM